MADAPPRPPAAVGRHALVGRRHRGGCAGVAVFGYAGLSQAFDREAKLAGQGGDGATVAFLFGPIDLGLCALRGGVIGLGVGLLLGVVAGGALGAARQASEETGGAWSPRVQAGAFAGTVALVVAALVALLRVIPVAW